MSLTESWGEQIEKSTQILYSETSSDEEKEDAIFALSIPYMPEQDDQIFSTYADVLCKTKNKHIFSYVMKYLNEKIKDRIGYCFDRKKNEFISASELPRDFYRNLCCSEFKITNEKDDNLFKVIINKLSRIQVDSVAKAYLP